MKKVLCINVSDQGSTGKIIEDVARNSKTYEYVLCVPKITKKSKVLRKYQLMTIPHEQGIYRRIAKVMGYPFGMAPLSTMKLIHIIKKEKPDLVHVHCMNMNMVNIYLLFRFLSKEKIATVITNHAEFYYTGSCAHAKECMQWVDGCEKCADLQQATDTWFDHTSCAWKKMKVAMQSINQLTVVSVSPWVFERCKKSGIMKNISQELIMNGIDTEVFRPREISNLSKRLQLGNKKVILHVTASFTDDINDIKGGHFVLDLAKKYQEDENLLFVVAGNAQLDIERRQFPNNLLLLGNINDQDELARLYSVANLTVITSKRETFSMPVAESLCCGTPVIGFRAGGPESIALEEFSEFVTYGDEEALEIAIIKWSTTKSPLFSKKCAACARAEFDSNNMAYKYEKVYETLLYKE